MSKYTTELRYIIEMGYDLGLKNYPIFDETHREELNKKIIDHYYFREIGFETVGLFKMYLNRTMNEIMPYYNGLYKSETFKFDPINTHSLNETETKNKKIDTSNTQTTTTNDSSNGTLDTINKSVESDTPQGLLSIGNIENQIYASQANIENNKDTSVNTRKGNIDGSLTGNENTDETVNKKQEGYIGDPNEALRKYRNNILNIDLMIIEELKDLFMLIY